MWPFRKNEERNAQPLAISNLEKYGSTAPESTANVFSVTSFISKQLANYQFEATPELESVINAGTEQANRSALWSSIYLALLNTGNAYLLLDWSKAGKLKSIQHVTASPTIHTDANAQPYIKSYNVGGKTFPLYKIAHFRINSLNGLMGRSPITVCREAVEGIKEVESYSTEIFQNIKRPSGLFKFTNTYKDKNAINTFRDSLAKSKQGQSLVLENGIEYQPLSLSAVDSQYVEQAKFSVEQACRLFALDPIFVSHSGTNSQSYASQREASKSLFNNTLRPYIEAVTAELHIKLLTPSQRLAGEKIEVNQNELQSLSVKERIEVYEKLLSAQVITPQQVAEIEGFDYADS